MKIQVNCQYCTKTFTARQADRNRGWAKYCSKSCKAKQQSKHTHHYTEYKEEIGHIQDSGYFGHGQS